MLKRLIAAALAIGLSVVGSPAWAEDETPPIIYDVVSGGQDQSNPGGVRVAETRTARGTDDGSQSASEGRSPNSDESARGCDTLVLPDKNCGAVERDVEGEPTVTLTDLAIFRPVAPALSGDPVGYGLMNAPANVIATATEQTIAGELFDRPVQVRFVPVRYTFDYGDGTSRASDTGGATWQALGVPQFTPTATTHAYGARGTYSANVTVAYAPFVNFGSGWRAVPGTISATTGGYAIQIVEARTALVERDCNEDPTGVGCPVG